MGNGDTDTIALAERIHSLLDQGSFSSTYKYALLIGLLDLCVEGMSAGGLPPTMVTTRKLAEKVVELYWPHATPYSSGRVLRQGGSGRDTQAEIVRAIVNFRDARAGSAEELLHRARSCDPVRFERLLRTVEWKLVEMPIPRLQTVGNHEERFLYEYGWTQGIRQSEVGRYQRGGNPEFDNRLLLKSGVAERLVRLNGLLRPLLQREWSAMVSQMNDLPEHRLQKFLFARSRVALECVRGPLSELQRGTCFYCDERLGKRAEVDHFVPWSRHPDDGIDNLVVAHEGCNRHKRDFLAATCHLQRWTARLSSSSADLETIATQAHWEREPGRTRAVAQALYGRLPGEACLWLREREFVSVDRNLVAEAFARVA